MNDEQWDDYITRREGTYFGDLANERHKQIMKPPETYHFPKKTPPPAEPEKTKNNFSNHLGKTTTSTEESGVSFSFILMLIGFVVGISLSDSMGLAPFFSGFICAIAGGLLIPFIRLAFKILIFLFRIGLVILLIYLLAKILSAA